MKDATFSSARLLALYERISDAEDAIPRLRRFVLDLAVRGKLVEQDESDEPAAELLTRIAAEKAMLLKAKAMRKPKDTVPLEADDLPFALPSGWIWTQIAQLGVISPRNEAADDFEASFVPMPLIAAEYGVANGLEARPWGEIKKGYTHFAEGDVGLAKITPCFENGKSTVFRGLIGGIGAGTTELHIVRPLFVDADYILLFLKCPHFIETGIPKMTGTAGQKRVPTEYFTSSPFPLPPLAEQQRIVAKVDELMALCDQLEQARAGREAVRDRLTTASLARLTAPETDAEALTAEVGTALSSGNATNTSAFQSHARFALQSLPTLTTRPDQIKTFRQTILNLAVRGKLVPQDTSDEPAADLLKRIAKEKARLVKAAAIKAGKPSQPISDAPFPVAPNWMWVRLSELASYIQRGKSPQYATADGLPVVSQKCVQWAGLDLAVARKITVESLKNYESVRFLRAGDLLWNSTGTGTIGRLVRLDEIPEKLVCDSHVTVVRCVFAEPEYVRIWLMSDHVYGLIEGKASGSTNQVELTAQMANAQPVPLPPLAEQRRIVAKVDELMALCDRLEASLTTTATTRSKLLGALLHEALEPAI